MKVRAVRPAPLFSGPPKRKPSARPTEARPAETVRVPRLWSLLLPRAYFSDRL